MQHAVVVLCWWCCMCTYMFLHIMLNQAQAKGSVGRVVNHSCCGRWRDREILFSVYLGIYCSTQCNITIQKQDPRSKLLHLNSITSPPTVKKAQFFFEAHSRSGYWSLIRWERLQTNHHFFSIHYNNVTQGSTTATELPPELLVLIVLL